MSARQLHITVSQGRAVRDEDIDTVRNAPPVLSSVGQAQRRTRVAL